MILTKIEDKNSMRQGCHEAIMMLRMVRGYVEVKTDMS